EESMRGNIISYMEMCQREGTSLQRGMNFRLKGGHSVILMSVRENSPYEDQITEDGTVLIYEGHDVPRSKGITDPKQIDQPKRRDSGSLTENGKFNKAAQDYKKELKGPDIVRVYEKIKPGIWSDNGYFHLVDSWIESDGKRNVFKFKLIAIEEVDDETLAEDNNNRELTRSRIIPTSVKLKVWKRDGGKCVECSATDELHFDHIVPFSKGGTSLKAENIQLLCVRHNLAKRDKIQ
ncbi:MAG: HNH endonuclease, partial [Fidelibacterota bacterium]